MARMTFIALGRDCQGPVVVTSDKDEATTRRLLKQQGRREFVLLTVAEAGILKETLRAALHEALNIAWMELTQARQEKS